MTVVVHCKRCRKQIKANDRYAGTPTRCPRCGTLNQLPSLPSADSEKKAASKESSGQRAKTVREEASSETCKICGKPIRGKAERFADVHGTVYHLPCYQKHAGAVSEHACRICHKAFDNPKERVKDVVGFFYHRECYYEELERQKLAASGGKPQEDAGPPVSTPVKPKPHAKPATDVDDWDLTSDDEDDWNLAEETNDDWMRPDPDELELKGEAKRSVPREPAAKPAAKTTPKGINRPATAPAEPKPRPPATATPSGRPSGIAKETTPSPARPTPLPARRAMPQPAPATPEPAPSPASDSAGKATPKASPSSSGTELRDSSSQRPPATSATTARRNVPAKQTRPLPRAKPIEEGPVAAAPMLPDGLELLPDEPTKLPDGLELLPDEPRPDVVEGLEILDDAPAVPTAYVVPVAPTFPPPLQAAAAVQAGLTPLDSHDPLGGLQALDGLEPLDGPAFSQPVQGIPLGSLGSAEPVQGVLLDPLTGQPAALYPRRGGSSNAIPTWLWVLMWIGVGVVVIMLLAAVVNLMMNSSQDTGPVASTEAPESNEFVPQADEALSDERTSPDSRSETP